MIESARYHSNWSNKIKIPKKSTTCRIKSFIAIKNINIEKLRLTKINTNKFSKVCLV